MNTDSRNWGWAMSQTAIVCTTLLALVSGCGETSVPEQYSGPPSVSGTVTIDQVALAEITVSFENSEGGPFQAVTDAAGNYVFESGESTPPLGKYLVRITDPAGAEPASDDAARSALPARYNSKPELVVDVLAGENSIDFPLLSATEEDGEESF